MITILDLGTLRAAIAIDGAKEAIKDLMDVKSQTDEAGESTQEIGAKSADA